MIHFYPFITQQPQFMMKPHAPLLTLCASLLLSSLTLAQNESFDPTGRQAEATLPRHVRTQVEYIEMSLEQMTELMQDEAATQNDTALRKRVAEWVKSKKAKIIETQMVIARSGEKATSESIREYIYPTEYEPSEIPNEVHLHNEDGDSKVPNKEIATGPTPTAFETRNLGATLEVEPTLTDDNLYIDLRLAPEIVYHVENMKWATWKDKHGQSDIMMPIMYSLRVNTALTLANGRPSLVAALSPKDEKGVTDFSRKVLVFVQCDIIVVGR